MKYTEVIKDELKNRSFMTFFISRGIFMVNTSTKNECLADELAKCFVVFTQKNTIPLSEISSYILKSGKLGLQLYFSEPFLLKVVKELYGEYGLMCYWTKTGTDYVLEKTTSRSFWQDVKDNIIKPSSNTPKAAAGKKAEKTHQYHERKPSYKDMLLEMGLCPKYGCVSHAGYR